MNVGPRRTLLYSEEQITAEVRRLAWEITLAYRGEELVLVVVLKGAFFFAADLARRIQLPLVLEFVKLSSYSGTSSTGAVAMIKDVEMPLHDRHVLIVEDIVDTGLSLAFLREKLSAHKPKSLKICTLINKRERRQVEVTADFTGFESPGGFLVGYGLDLDEKLRELPAIYELHE
ncbi:hypoxanthine phosphoribosyltransferase [Geotalea sp. SG265]|uniref:hypoxanthine phosphoribosyltransferase n=1 Tax=Geotalea sp. SG265 TaxID=2922867 RepID=UPI0024350270|nr:hypoxanthine phosphoribosyltransferase [Geotalea sp. SG265]